ncbi:hypothetical protein ANCDUO_05438 [Ancylostoma duodenale]|uniref:BTB domain-containing protein n=1 Tax=Ancylostoma duodenale TaxID=51022 RepID=A0A0C2GSJ2_9BILA|nr:hypothetical protein ANCDUO_05438 [Ancylostoma duodenale]
MDVDFTLRQCQWLPSSYGELADEEKGSNSMGLPLPEFQQRAQLLMPTNKCSTSSVPEPSSDGSGGHSMGIDEPRSSQFFASLQELRGKFCDVELLVGTHRIKAHRIVLVSSIPYFRAMFTSKMSEARRKQIHMTGESRERQSLLHIQ